MSDSMDDVSFHLVLKKGAAHSNVKVTEFLFYRMDMPWDHAMNVAQRVQARGYASLSTGSFGDAFLMMSILSAAGFDSCIHCENRRIRSRFWNLVKRRRDYLRQAGQLAGSTASGNLENAGGHLRVIDRHLARLREALSVRSGM